MPDEEDVLRVLHALRLVGFGEDEVVANRSGLAPAEARPVLVAARASGWVLRRDGRRSGWSLTAEGRAEGSRLLAGEMERAGAGDAIADGYRRFRAVNQRFLDLCTDWQLRTDGSGEQRIINDHSDAAYDDQVVHGLGGLDDLIQPVLAELAVALVRFRGYGPRLAAARTAVEAGERDWFTRPVIDSYHTVWFELHEDLLATLGLERSHEH